MQLSMHNATTAAKEEYGYNDYPYSSF